MSERYFSHPNRVCLYDGNEEVLAVDIPGQPACAARMALDRYIWDRARDHGELTKRHKLRAEVYSRRTGKAFSYRVEGCLSTQLFSRREVSDDE